MPGKVIVGDSDLCCCVSVQCVTSILLFERNYFPLFIDSTHSEFRVPAAQFLTGYSIGLGKSQTHFRLVNFTYDVTERDTMAEENIGMSTE